MSRFSQWLSERFNNEVRNGVFKISPLHGSRDPRIMITCTEDGVTRNVAEIHMALTMTNDKEATRFLDNTKIPVAQLFTECLEEHYSSKKPAETESPQTLYARTPIQWRWKNYSGLLNPIYEVCGSTVDVANNLERTFPLCRIEFFNRPFSKLLERQSLMKAFTARLNTLPGLSPRQSGTATTVEFTIH